MSCSSGSTWSCTGMLRVWLVARFRWDHSGDQRPDKSILGRSTAEGLSSPIQLPALQRTHRRGSADPVRCGSARVPARSSSRSPGPRRLDRRDARRSSTPRSPELRRTRASTREGRAARRSLGLQGGRARLRHAQRAQRASSLVRVRRRLRAAVRLPASTRTPRFDDPEVGMVQARWGHENREESR